MRIIFITYLLVLVLIPIHAWSLALEPSNCCYTMVMTGRKLCLPVDKSGYLLISPKETCSDVKGYLVFDCKECKGDTNDTRR